MLASEPPIKPWQPPKNRDGSKLPPSTRHRKSRANSRNTGTSSFVALLRLSTKCTRSPATFFASSCVVGR